MKKILALILFFTFFALDSSLLKAQDIEGTPYYLPKTELRFRLLIEKSDFTPGEFAYYADRFLKKTASTEASQTYRLLGIEMYTTAVPDSAKHFYVPVDKRHTIFNVDCNHDGILLAVNTKGKKTEAPAPFIKRKAAKMLNPRDFMNEDILKAGSTAKMAELTAHEIYEIRSSREELSRGEADYMPKDGEQLRLMFQNLDKQESALTQSFMGATVCDTLQQEIAFTPEKTTTREMLFRFSRKLGLVDNDDLSGTPYYINVQDLEITPDVQTEAEGMKPTKELGVTINVPSKIRITITEGTNTVQTFETYAGQFGSTEVLSGNLFGKKFSTSVQLDPITGVVDNMIVQPLE